MKQSVRLSVPVLVLLLLLGRLPEPGLADDSEPGAGDGPHVQPLEESGEPAGSTGTNRSKDCALPAEVGLCKAALPRFFYNATSGACETFTYGGCGGNKNNFEEVASCNALCVEDTGPGLNSTSKKPRFALLPPVEPTESAPTQKTEISAEEYSELCEVKPEVGPCRAAFPRWFYNQETSSCESFVYGGCRGNKNNHKTKEDCTAACAVKVLLSRKQSDDEVCSLTPDPGHCRAAFPSYFYEPNSATCQSFLYGGCGGNGNRFGTVEECLSRCHNPGVSENREQSRWTAAVFLFSTLTVLSALLLLALIIITLRRRGLPRRNSSVSDKEELLSDRQSMDSLSIIDGPRPEPKA